MNELADFAQRLLTDRHIASLATTNADGSLHQTAVWYLYQDGLFYVTTGSASRKARNLRARPQASLMIDTRDPGNEQGLAVAGSAEVFTGEEAAPFVHAIHSRYMTPAGLADPVVGPTYEAYDDAIIRLTPKTWTTWDIAKNSRELSERLNVAGGYLYPMDGA